MRESAIEKYFTQQVKLLGGEAEKFSSPGRKGVPDRIVWFKYPHISLVEFKAPNKKTTAAQNRDHRRRREKGYEVYIVDNKDYAYKLAHELFYKAQWA